MSEANQHQHPMVEVTIRDGLRLPMGQLSPGWYDCVIYCRALPEWVEKEQMAAVGLEAVYAGLYGPQWRYGNDDGSQYVVMSVSSRLLSPEETAAAEWRGLSNTKERHYWFFRASDAGVCASIDLAEL
jgi:hypothetical protein